MRFTSCIAVGVIASLMVTGSVEARGLKRLFDGGGDSSGSSVLGLVGGSDSGALVTIGSGSAGDSGAVNIGLGGGGGNVLDANIGGSSDNATSANVSLGGDSLAKASVSSGGSDGISAGASIGGSSSLASVGASVGGSSGISAGATVGGVESLAKVDVNVGGPGGLGGNVDVDVGGLPGLPGTPGLPGLPGIPSLPALPGLKPNVLLNANGGVFGSAGGSGAGGLSFGATNPACAKNDPRALMGMSARTNPREWNGAGGAEVVRVGVCSEIRGQMADYLVKDRSYRQMVGAVAAHPVISSALRQTPYQPGHVLAVERVGGKLMVYVF